MQISAATTEKNIFNYSLAGFTTVPEMPATRPDEF